VNKYQSMDLEGMDRLSFLIGFFPDSLLIRPGHGGIKGGGQPSGGNQLWTSAGKSRGFSFIVFY
jgi:hypothetical protein